MARSRHRLKGKIVKLQRGLAIYQTHASPFYFVRILDVHTKLYTVRSTKETSLIQARRVAGELAQLIFAQKALGPPEFHFRSFARRLVANGVRMVESGKRNRNYIRTTKLFLDNDEWGLVGHFGTRDVRELRTRDWQLFIEGLAKKRPDLSSSQITSPQDDTSAAPWIADVWNTEPRPIG